MRSDWLETEEAEEMVRWWLGDGSQAQEAAGLDHSSRVTGQNDASPPYRTC
jgi:hypothetical protein